MAIRVECTIPGFEDNWLEVAETWSRRELRDFVNLRGDGYIALWRAKVSGCHLRTVDGRTITDPAAVYGPEGAFEDLDLRLVDFVSLAVLDATDYLLRLGEANRRLSSAGGVAIVQPTTTPMPPTPAG